MNAGPSREEIIVKAKAGDARAQYVLAAALQGEGKRDEAESWLQSAANGGEPDALYTLATRAILKDRNAGESARLAAAAADKGSAAARRLCAVFLAEGIGQVEDWRAARRAVLTLAQEGDAAAQREIAGLLILDNPEDENAAALVAMACEKDAVAAAVCARRYALGRSGADRASAQRAAKQLAAANYPRATVLSDGIEQATGADNARSQPSWPTIEQALSAAPAYGAPAGEALCASPDVRLHKSAVAPEMLEYVIAHAAARLRPSTTVDSRDGSVRLDAYRTSLTSTLGPVDLDLPLLEINRRMAVAADHDPHYAEYLSVLRYAPGQEYRPHFDWLAPSEDMSVAGQRVKTALLFLNDDFAGGETHFLAPDLKVKARAGDILYFSNVLADGAPDMRARHAGLPVTRGLKWIASKWFRSQAYKI